MSDGPIGGSTTGSGARKRTVAEPSEASTELESGLGDTPVDATAQPAESVVPVDQDKGFCDNHPDRPAVVMTPFPWVSTQRFCNICVPEQYRYLLP